MDQFSKYEQNILCRALSTFQASAKGDEADVARSIYYKLTSEMHSPNTLPQPSAQEDENKATRGNKSNF